MTRGLLCRWLGWLILANAVLFCLIGLNLIWVMPIPGYVPHLTLRGEIAAIFFVIFTYIGQFTLLSMLAALPVLLLTLLIPKRGFVFVIAIIWMALANVYLVIDSVVYHIYHFHMLGVVWQILISGAFSQVIVLSTTEYLFAAGLVLIAVLIECALAFWIWRKIDGHEPKGYGKRMALILAACLFISYTMFMTALHATSMRQLAIMSHHLIEMDAEVFPFYETIIGPIALGENGANKMQGANAGFYVQQEQVQHPLNIPLKPMAFKTPKKPLNIVIIGIDTWRYDMMNSRVSPNIYRFSQRSLQFHDHYSGGNSTRPGLFSLFYSIPPTYWSAMLNQHRGSLFIDTLMKKHYQMGVFMSASMKYPAFNKTVFLNLPHKILDTPGKYTYQRDEGITAEFKHFIKTRNPNKPLFSFLFYDGVHNYCDTWPRKIMMRFLPVQEHCDRFDVTDRTDVLPYMNRYRSAVYFDDQQVEKDLQLIKKAGLLKNTVVIITADHGESFNDNDDGYWGHASGFVSYQTHVPMIVHWPKKAAANIDYKTSHYDIVPTLMTQVLGSTNPTIDYSVGHSLFKKGGRPFIIAGSYIDYAILTNKYITTIYPQGTYRVMNLQGKIIPGARLNMPIVRKAYALLTRYFKK